MKKKGKEKLRNGWVKKGKKGWIEGKEKESANEQTRECKKENKVKHK